MSYCARTNTPSHARHAGKRPPKRTNWSGSRRRKALVAVTAAAAATRGRQAPGRGPPSEPSPNRRRSGLSANSAPLSRDLGQNPRFSLIRPTKLPVKEPYYITRQLTARSRRGTDCRHGRLKRRSTRLRRVIREIIGPVFPAQRPVGRAPPGCPAALAGRSAPPVPREAARPRHPALAARREPEPRLAVNRAGTLRGPTV